ncbi:HlyD family secretion protein [Lichenicoccus sp.]|uniref:HlyD family secretion protein n=1 Tax=Lichenicoccus sp. TaxID=2781899 RepID=UPI003D0C9DF2
MTKNMVSHAIVAVLVVLAASAFLIDWNVLLAPVGGRWTNDATLQGDPIALASRATGYLVAVPVRDYARVHAGDLLFAIDDSGARARVARANAEVAAASAGIVEARTAIALQQARIVADAAVVEGGEAELERARLERVRQSRLLHTESFLARDWEDAVAVERRAAATVEGDRRALAAAQAALGTLQAQVLASQANLAAQRAALRLAQVQLGYTRITAPLDGVVTSRLARLGEYVSPGRALITLVPLRDVWVVANYREVQLTRIRIGQRARVLVDALPGVRLSGHVGSFEPASQAVGSSLPPDRATGNFTKVVQRVPVKIVLDPRPDLLERLRPGLSAEVRILTGSSGPASKSP